MEPQMIDAYNDFPYGVNVIEELNRELEKVQSENESLKKVIFGFKRVIEEYRKTKDLETIFEELRRKEEINRRKQERKNKFGCF